MKKIVCIFAIFLMAAAGLSAQDNEKVEKPWNLALKGGGLVSINENAYSYRENGTFQKLFGYQAGLAVGYDFTKLFGIRLDALYGKNAGAGNTRETSGDKYYPYTFSSVSAFLDAIVNVNPNGTLFYPKFYAGLGGACSFGFSELNHPSQKLPAVAGAFGVRIGFIAEFRVSPVFSIYADLSSEGFTDKFDGMKPSKEEIKETEGYPGYPGFPLDVRGLASLGLCFHF